MKVTVGIPTKNRYDTLDKTLLSIALQTYSPHEVIIVDDTDDPINITTIPHYEYILKTLDSKKIRWEVLFGKKKGQHHSHQLIQEKAEGELVFRIDDDEVAEPDVLKKLSRHFSDPNVYAVGPSVIEPWAGPVPMGLRNKITSVRSAPNMQWFRGEDKWDADHLYSCFMYRPNVVRYDLNLSTVCHREETIFSYSMKIGGPNRKLLVDMDAVVYHYRNAGGGIRTFRDPILWEHDEKIFNGYMALWGITDSEKMVVLDCGIGDHWAFKNILPELRKKHDKITVAACFPDVFWDEPDLKLISIADAKNMYGNIDAFQVYKLLWDSKEKMHLIEAFRKLYL